MNNRRQFLTGCSILTAAAAIMPPNLLASLGKAPIRFAEIPSCREFQAQLKTSFLASTESGASAELELVGVTPWECAHPLTAGTWDAGHEKFSLQFRSVSARRLADAIHRLEHPSLGNVELFIVPVGPVKAGVAHYEAVINRAVPGPSHV